MDGICCYPEWLIRRADVLSNYVVFPCGVIRGVLFSLGLSSAVTAEFPSPPTCKYLPGLPLGRVRCGCNPALRDTGRCIHDSDQELGPLQHAYQCVDSVVYIYSPSMNRAFFTRPPSIRSRLRFPFFVTYLNSSLNVDKGKTLLFPWRLEAELSSQDHMANVDEDLLRAAEDGNYDELLTLLENGASVHYVGDMGWYSFSHGHVHLI